MKIEGTTKLYALIGDPIEHSMSPILHNIAFRKKRLNCVYLAFRVKKEKLKTAIEGIRTLGISGLNITMPHKINIMKYLDQLHTSSKKSGSVNTVLKKKNKLIGFTTDGIGALNALKYNKVNLIGKKIVILGAGGASRALAFAFIDKVEEIIIVNRTLSKAENIINNLSHWYGNDINIKAKHFTSKNLEIELKDTNILINATPLGMIPKEKTSPVNIKFLNPNMTVFDLVYNPFKTKLIKDAEERGIKTIRGIEMLIHQAAASFEIWFQKKAPIEDMMKEALKNPNNYDKYKG